MIKETHPEQTAYEIACFTINKCIDDKEPISNIQLQRILFLLQKAFIKERGEVLFDDDFAAWKYGPVVESVYRKFSINGGDRIYRRVDIAYIPLSIQKIINPVIEKTATMYPWDITGMCREKNGAWYVTYNDGENFGDIINKELIFYEVKKDQVLSDRLKAMGKGEDSEIDNSR